MKAINLHLKIWRQDGPNNVGRLETYEAKNISTEMSFLEMLDVVNEDLIKSDKEPIQFDNDCREGICGMCSTVINGVAHGPWKATASCQLHMREYKDGDTIVIEPWRAKAFPLLRDLVVDRTALDRVIQAGGFVSINAGGAQDANALPVPKDNAELAMDAAACIGCGACVASCPNASAALFVGAKVSQFALLPQGQPERERRVLRMVEQMDKEGFGSCSNHGECEAVCPKQVSIVNIARMRREYVRAMLTA